MKRLVIFFASLPHYTASEMPYSRARAIRIMVCLFLFISNSNNAQNLVLNGSAELPLVNDEIPFWEEVIGTQWSVFSQNPSPFSGSFYFFAGANNLAELKQVIDVTDYSCAIDHGSQYFELMAYARAYQQVPPDESHIYIDFNDSNNVVLSTYHSGAYVNTSNWSQINALISAPPGTRNLVIRLRSVRNTGIENDGYFDDISLTPVPANKNIELDWVDAFGTSCGASNGLINIHTVGGGYPVLFSLNGQSFQTDSNFTNLAAGIYTIYITDNYGCSDTQTAVVQQVTTLLIDSVTVTADSCAQGKGTITIANSGGLAPFQYSLNGVNFNFSNRFADLDSGFYTVYVLDSNTCVRSQQTFIPATPSPRIDYIYMSPDTCGRHDGMVSITASGGTGTLLYADDKLTFQTGNHFAGLPPGTMSFYIKDSIGCMIDFTQLIPAIYPPYIEKTIVTPDFCDYGSGTLHIITKGGNGQLNYMVDGKQFAQNNIHQLSSGLHHVVIYDQYQCMATTEIIIEDSCNVYAPNSFTPNNDGVNDEFKIYSTNEDKLEITIYNKWGEIVFYSNDATQQTWNGRHDGNFQPQGVYIYYLKSSDKSVTSFTSGKVTLLR